MKIWILSDLHYEMQAHLPLTIPEADVAVLAGDINRPLEVAVEWAAMEIAWRMPVILVPGNHEFYSNSVAGGLRRGSEAAARHPHVHLLVDSSVEIDGVRFVGGILWTDYALGAESTPGEGRDRDVAYAMRNAGSMLNDHRAIRKIDSKDLVPPMTWETNFWSPADARQAHQRTRAFLEAVLSEEFNGPTVVVTHHASTPLSVAARFQGSPLNPAFASDLTDLIWQFQPRIWVHGHVHDSFDYTLGDTRVIANPRGYGDENGSFDPMLVVEIG